MSASIGIDVYKRQGYYCVDNLPPILIARFADICWKSTSNTRHVAVVTDIRGGSFFDALPQALKELEKRGIPHEVVFLEASDEALVRRYMETVSYTHLDVYKRQSACRTAFTQPKTSQNPIRPIRTPSAI